MLSPALFRRCLEYWIEFDGIGRTFKEDMKLDKINGQMKGYKMYADVVPIKMIATDGGDFMDELRWIE